LGLFAANAAKLVGSGVVSALALSVITSNRWHVLDPNVGVTLVLFMQWQILGLTLTKMGIDQMIFAAITHDSAQKPDTRKHMLSRALPVSLIFAVLVVLVFGPWAGAACFASLLFDTKAVLILAELNAREKYTDVMIANMLNYPLFFALVFGLQLWTPVSLPLVFLVFVFTSFARWAWLSIAIRHETPLPERQFEGTVLSGLPPLLNLLLFRVDQVLLGTTAIMTLVATVGNDFVRQILFVDRYPEIVSGGLTALTGLLLPRLYLHYPFTIQELIASSAKRWWLIAVYVLIMVLPLALYALLWRGAPLSPILLAAGAVSAILILPTNALTYSMIRQGYLRGLVRNLTIAVLTGLIVIAAGYAFRVPFGVVVAVPLQLLVFVVTTLVMSWRAGRQAGA